MRNGSRLSSTSVCRHARRGQDARRLKHALVHGRPHPNDVLAAHRQAKCARGCGALDQHHPGNSRSSETHASTGADFLTRTTGQVRDGAKADLSNDSDVGKVFDETQKGNSGLQRSGAVLVEFELLVRDRAMRHLEMKGRMTHTLGRSSADIGSKEDDWCELLDFECHLPPLGDSELMARIFVRAGKLLIALVAGERLEPPPLRRSFGP